MAYSDFERWRDHSLDAQPELSIVIPAYNERGTATAEEVQLDDRIRPTLAAMAVVVSELIPSWELIVSDDGSTDGTPETIASLEWANLRVLRSPNTGKGGAVRRGVLAARGKYILFADADNSTPVEQLALLLEQLRQGFDLAIGSRAAQGAEEANKSLLRKTVSSGVRLVAQLMSGVRVKDTQCGFKMFRHDAAKDIFGRQVIDGFSFDVEILYLAQKFGYRIVEIPVQWFDAPGSKVNVLKDSILFFKDILRVRQLDFAGAYQSNKPSQATFKQNERETI